MTKSNSLTSMRMNVHVEDFSMKVNDLNNSVMILTGVCKIVDFLFKNLECKIEQETSSPEFLEGYSTAVTEAARFLEEVNEDHMKDLLDVIGWQRSEIWDLEKMKHESE